MRRIRKFDEAKLNPPTGFRNTVPDEYRVLLNSLDYKYVSSTGTNMGRPDLITGRYINTKQYDTNKMEIETSHNGYGFYPYDFRTYWISNDEEIIVLTYPSNNSFRQYRFSKSKEALMKYDLSDNIGEY